MKENKLWGDMDQNIAPTETVEPKKSPVLAIVLVIIILGVVAAAYFLFFAKKTGSSIVKSIVPVSATCKYNDPDLCKFVNGWKNIKYFTINSTSTFEGKEVKFVMKSIGDDKSQMISSQSGTEDMNIISIANDTYTKDYTDQKWTKITSNPDNSTIKDIKDELEFDQKAEATDDKTQYKKIGTEACGKLTCFKYQVIDPAITDSTEYVLFDNKDYQLRKTISIGKDGNQATAEFDYAKISIDVPSPIKESTTNAVPPTSIETQTTNTNATTPTGSDDNQSVDQVQLDTGATDSTDTTVDTTE